MEADPKAADSSWFVVPAREKPRTQSEPLTLGDRIMKALGIAKWSDLLAEVTSPTSASDRRPIAWSGRRSGRTLCPSAGFDWKQA